MNLYLIRHGYTEENLKSSYYGTMDPELNEKGILQCEFLKERLKDKTFQAVYTSTKKRAIDSAKIILSDYSIKINNQKELDERSFGIFEGLNYEELSSKYKNEYEAWEKDWIGYKIKNGESHLEFSTRVYNFLEKILGKHKEDENIIIVAHAGVIRAIYTYVIDKKVELFWKFGCRNGDLAIIKYEYGNLYIDSIVHNKY
ncbi:alpha-ribazole phosphatase [Hathewaya histolytica]|uniref:alpha-ribazole phosphatase n=1 Tax=Hathewaya histolytica TaxID=1498 RepID=UPI003B67E237